MNRGFDDLLFGVCTVLLIAGTLIYLPGVIDDGVQGQAFRPRDSIVPNVQLVAPNDGASIYGPVHTLVYEVNSVDYDVKCSVIVDGEVLEVQDVPIGQFGKLKIELLNGYHDWRVVCDLMSGRTISSIKKSFIIKDYKKMPEELNMVTGNASLDVSKVFDARSYMVVLIGLAFLVWAVNFHRTESDKKPRKK